MIPHKHFARSANIVFHRQFRMSLVRPCHPMPDDENKKRTIVKRYEEKRAEFSKKRLEVRQKWDDKKQQIKDRRKERRTQMQMNIFDRFLDYLKSYGTILEKAFPDVLVKTYRVFSSGSSALLRDMKTFSWVQHKLMSTNNRDDTFSSFTRHELEVYNGIPRDLFRVGPVLLISALPFAQNVVFPLALLYPTTFLSSQFWSDQNRKDAYEAENIQRRKAFFPVLESVQHNLSRAKEPDVRELLRANLTAVLSGRHPSHQQILSSLPLFSPGEVFHLPSLSSRHARLLLRLHNLPRWGLTWLWPHWRLRKHGLLLLAMDRAVAREGSRMMDHQQLVHCCHLRGAYFGGPDAGEELRYLTEWAKVSVHVTEQNLALLLHLPIFIAYHRH